MVFTMLATPLAAQTSPAPHDAADSLAAIVLPRDATIAMRLPRFDTLFARRMKDDKRLSELESTHPGITSAVTVVARDEAAKSYGRAIDALQADTAALYRARFTERELHTLAGFFSSKTGQPLIKLSAGASGDTSTEFETDRRRKAIDMFGNPDAQTKADLNGLLESGLLPRMQALAPEISALSARRFDDVARTFDAALPSRIDAVVATYTKSAER
jgi:hypothetical protein